VVGYPDRRGTGRQALGYVLSMLYALYDDRKSGDLFEEVDITEAEALLLIQYVPSSAQGGIMIAKCKMSRTRAA
jgi:hypothetical protein